MTQSHSTRAGDKLTIKQIDHARPGRGKKTKRLSDGKGLTLLVTSSCKSWQFRYRDPLTHKQDTARLGLYPDVGLVEARDKAKAIRKDLGNGITPKERERLDQEALRQLAVERATTFETVAREWYDDVSSHWKNEKHRKTVLASLKSDVFPVIGDMPLNDVSRRDVVRTIKAITNSGRWDTAPRVLSRIRMVYDWAIEDQGIANDNPAAGYRIKFPASRQEKHYPALRAAELPKFLDDFDSYRDRMDPVTAYAVEFLMRTYVRPGMVENAKWEQINLRKREWYIPGNEMKRPRDHVVYLTDQLVSLLKDLRKISGNRVYLFPGRNPSRPISNATLRNAIYSMGDYKGRHCPHGFRSTADTWLEELGTFSDAALEYTMAHAVGNATTRAYRRFDPYKYWDERKQIAETWNRFIDTCRNKKVTRLRKSS
jgi:integrase